MGKLLLGVVLLVIASLTLAMEAREASQTEEGFLFRTQRSDVACQQEADAMPVIGREQMEAMDRAMMERFVDKSIEFIRINFPTGARTSPMKPSPGSSTR